MIDDADPRLARKSLWRGGAASLAVKTAQVAAAFVVTFVLARALGAEGLGVYAFAWSVVMVLGIPVQVGLPQLVLRETAASVAREEWGQLRGLWRWSEGVVLGLSAAVAGLAAALLWAAPEFLGTERRTTLAVGLAVLPLVGLGNLRGAALRGLTHVALGQLPEAVLRPFLFAAAVSLFAFWWEGPVPPALAMALLAGASAVAWGTGRGLLLRRRPVALAAGPAPVFRSRAWLAAALPLGAVAALQLVLGHMDVLMLGVLRSDAEVGTYRVAVQLSLLVGLGLQIAHMVIAPWVARYRVEGRAEELQQVVRGASRAVLAFSLPVSALLVLFGKPALALLFGAPFVAAWPALVVLSLGRLCSGAFGPVGLVLQMTGFERETLLGVGLAALVNLLLNGLLIPFFGGTGAAAATALALVLSHLVLHRLTLLRLGIDASVLSWPRRRVVAGDVG